MMTAFAVLPLVAAALAIYSLFRPDLKPPARIRASVSTWKRLRRVKGGPCRICGERVTTLHHLVPRSMGGDDVEDNLVPLCGSGTTGHHGAVENRDPVACSALREKLTESECTYVARKMSARFLDRYYPERSRDAARARD